ncbi:MAG: hypothetical protein E3K40_06165 [Candidatus Brocadia sp.]|nr:hypothetical protein [Candidatus Brocadia sp.]
MSCSTNFLPGCREEDRIGVAIDLAWTETGGDIIFVEASQRRKCLQP